MAKNLAMISLCFACGFWNSPSWGQQWVCLSFQQQNNQAADVRGIPALERSQGQSTLAVTQPGSENYCLFWLALNSSLWTLCLF